LEVKSNFFEGQAFSVEQVQAGLYRMVSKPEKEQSGPAPYDQADISTQS
jgi:hypothetical protein